MDKEMRAYYYICDRKKECKNTSVCGKTCRHTKDESHAKIKGQHWFYPVRAPGEYQMWEIERPRSLETFL